MENQTQGQSKIRWGQARNEVLALQEEILAAREDGQSILKIHRDLEAKGKVTVSYGKFKKHVDRYIVPETQRPQAPPKVSSSKNDDHQTSQPQRSVTVIPYAQTEEANASDTRQLDELWSGATK